jgi:hypothetical protein
VDNRLAQVWIRALQPPQGHDTRVRSVEAFCVAVGTLIVEPPEKIVAAKVA